MICDRTGQPVGEIGMDGMECQELQRGGVKVLDVLGLGFVPVPGVGRFPLFESGKHEPRIVQSRLHTLIDGLGVKDTNPFLARVPHGVEKRAITERLHLCKLPLNCRRQGIRAWAGEGRSEVEVVSEPVRRYVGDVVELFVRSGRLDVPGLQHVHDQIVRFGFHLALSEAVTGRLFRAGRISQGSLGHATIFRSLHALSTASSVGDLGEIVEQGSCEGHVIDFPLVAEIQGRWLEDDQRAGFRHGKLIVYAVQYELASTRPSWPIVWLDSEGDSVPPWVRPAGQHRRIGGDQNRRRDPAPRGADDGHEHGARMTSMDSATETTRELIRSLTLEMNKARQSQITTELTEIVAGAEAL